MYKTIIKLKMYYNYTSDFKILSAKNQQHTT